MLWLPNGLLTHRSLTAAFKHTGIAERNDLALAGRGRAALAEPRRATFNAGIERFQALTGRGVAALEHLREEKKHLAVAARGRTRHAS
jgi:hypothetical protein